MPHLHSLHKESDRIRKYAKVGCYIVHKREMNSHSECTGYHMWNLIDYDQDHSGV